jgi:type I restriction enzyme, S subunit
MSQKKDVSNELVKAFKQAKFDLISKKLLVDKKDKHTYPVMPPFETPNHYKWLYLSDASVIQEGPGLRKHQYTESGVQFLTVTNILEGSIDFTKSQKYIDKQEYEKKYKHFTINKGDIVTACSGATWGKSAIFDDDYLMILNTSTLRLRFFKDLGENKYLYYLTKSNFFKTNLSSHSTGQQPNYGYSHYSKIPIPIPPLSEQKQIVETLDKAFEKIDKAIANIERNIENAEEYLGNSIVELFVKSNWKKYDWGDVCNFTRGPFGGSLKKSMFKESGYAVYEQKQAIHNDYKSLRYFIDEGKFKEMERFQVSTGDLLMSCSGVTLGRVSEVPEDAPNGIINQALLRLRTNKNMILNEFVKIWIESRVFQKLIFEYSGGAAQPNVPGVKILKKIKIPCPKIDEQKSFINKYKNISSNISNYNKKQNNKLISLKELKKSILEKAFKGELTSAA